MKKVSFVLQFEFKLKCGSGRGASCGLIVNPKNYKDCSMYSEKSNSCCFYSYKGSTNCVWLGNSDVGTMKYKDLLLICKGEKIKYNAVLLYIIIIALLF